MENGKQRMENDMLRTSFASVCVCVSFANRPQKYKSIQSKCRQHFTEANQQPTRQEDSHRDRDRVRRSMESEEREENCKRVLHFVCHCVKWKLYEGDDAGENLEKWQTRWSDDNGKDDNKNGGYG